MFKAKDQTTLGFIETKDESQYLQGLNNLLQISTVSANESRTAEEAFRLVLDAVCLFMDWPIGHVYFVDRENLLYPSDLWHIRDRQKFNNFYETSMKTNFVIGEGLPGMVFALGKPVWIEDISKDLNFFRSKETEEAGLKAAFGLPIITNNKVMAIMEFFNEKTLKPDYYFLRVASQISVQLGKIIEKKLFIEKLNQQVKELETMNEDSKNTSKIIFNIFDDLLMIQKKLKDEKNKTQKIISAMGSGLLVINSNFHVLMMNKSAENILDLDFEKLKYSDIRKSIYLYKGKEKIDWEESALVSQNGQTNLEDNIFFKTVSGRFFPTTTTTSEHKEDLIRIIVFQDASVEKKFDESRENFISTASHQLRTPLTSIRWYAEMLKTEEAGKLNKEQADFLNEIHTGAMRLSEIINSLLMIARIEGGRQKTSLEKINVKVLAKKILKDINPQIIKKHLTVVFKLNLKTQIFCDKTVLSQLITILLTNATRYTNDNGKIEVAVEENGKELIFSVKDDGIGIPQDQQKQVFDKFFRADNAVNKVSDGNGLGLVLAKNFVETWNGRIWFESPTRWQDVSGKEEQKGTIFYFTMPLISSHTQL